MSIKKLFILAAMVLAPSMIFAMEEVPTEAQESSPKRIRVDDFELSPDDNLELWRMEMSAYISNLDVAGVRAQLALDDAVKISSEERDVLFQAADKRDKLVATMQRAALQLTEDATNDLVRQKFSLGEESWQASQIKKLLYAYKFLKRFKFPQAHFNPRPYGYDVRPSLDKVLEALIMNEQKGVSLCCFHITLYTIAQHLVNQKNEGVRVELVTNQKQGEAAPLQAIKHLVENGIPVAAPRTRSFETNHHKFVIFTSNVLNKPLIWSGSYNATGHSNMNSWEDVTILDDAEVIQQFQDRFDEIKRVSLPITLKELNSASNNASPTSLKNNNVPQELWPE